MSLAEVWIVLLVGLTLCRAAPTIAPAVSPEDEDLAQGYVAQYYSDVGTSNSSKRSISNDSFSEGLKTMQAFFGLEVTGVLDTETTRVMKAPRCGVSDISRYGHFKGKLKWKKRLITYRITEYTSDLTKSEVDETIAQAFQLYSDIIPLDFEQIDFGTADITILFKGGHHGDFYPFDGESGELAHAYSPGQDQQGDTHFDEDETWTLTERGANLLLVAAHEFGHTLGLDHSRDTKSLMFPSYHYVNTTGYKLPDDDERGIVALYGPRTPGPTTEPTPEPPPQPEPEPEPEESTEGPDQESNPQDEQCSRNLVFDAATSIRGDLFFFKDKYYWRKSESFHKIPLIRVGKKWPEINHVDAAFEVPQNDAAYLFEGRKYWGISSFTKIIVQDYPKFITELGLPSSVEKVDAAVYVPSTGKTLIFVNNQYWSYNNTINQMDDGYPRYTAQDFPGVGSRVDAAFENSGHLYFSSGARQSEFYLPDKKVTRVLLNYGWLNCY